MVRSFLVGAAAVSFALPGLAAAQQPAYTTTQAPITMTAATAVQPASATVSPTPAGPREDVAGIQPRAQNRDRDFTVTTAAPPRKMHEGESVALMAVGGAGLITGLLIRGNSGALVSLGGAVVGLYGLYLYLR